MLPMGVLGGVLSMRAISILGFLVLAAIGMVALAVPRAHAEGFYSCVEDCVATQSCMETMPRRECSPTRSECEDRCMHKARRKSYGAIAYGPRSRAWGTAYKWRSRHRAESTALKNCGKSDCRTLVWFEHQCGAVALDHRTGDYGWDHNANKHAAEARALRNCARQGGRHCRTLVSVCSF